LNRLLIPIAPTSQFALDRLTDRAGLRMKIAPRGGEIGVVVEDGVNGIVRFA
jgi:hypothetical protein